MNRFARLSAVLGIATLTALSAASASTMGDTMAKTIQSLSPSNFNVVTLSSLRDNATGKGEYFNYVPEHAADAAKIVASVRQNKPLERALQAQNVEINNIAGMQQAADGSVTFVLK